MRILMVNKFFYVKGGSETYYFALRRLLEARGHTVIDFSMQDERNLPSPYSGYFVGPVDYGPGGSPAAQVRAAARILYSFEAKRKFRRLVEDTRPDLVHLHLFQHQISPSILDVIREKRLPAVYTAHDLKMLCPNYKMMHHGRICRECRGGRYDRCAVHRCVKNSFAKSCVSAAEGYLHRLRRSYDAIGQIITPSAFYRRLFVEFGVEPGRVMHIPNVLDRAALRVRPLRDKEGYYLYLGRLSEEKGLLTLVRAFAGSALRLKIVGTGPLEPQLRSRTRTAGNIELLGFRTGQELTDLTGNARAVILPSEWYENGPYSAIEALQLGRPLVGADIGGIPELVDGNGYLFPPGSADALRQAVLRLEALPEPEYRTMSEASRRVFAGRYTARTHLSLLRRAYRRAGAPEL